jgi:hypothetical protein
LDATDYGALILSLKEAETAVVVDDSFASGLELKMCPSCRVRIEKNEGCSSMVCYRCGTKFQWGEATTVPEPKGTLRASGGGGGGGGSNGGGGRGGVGDAGGTRGEAPFRLAEAKWQGSPHWHRGRVEYVTLNPSTSEVVSYAIAFTDGTYEGAVPARDVRAWVAPRRDPRQVPTSVRRFTNALGSALGLMHNPFVVGEAVTARWRHDQGQWFPGVVTVARPDGSYDITYTAGDFEESVPHRRVQPRARHDDLRHAQITGRRGYWR